MLPLAITLIIGLLIGFAAGYGVAPRITGGDPGAAVAQQPLPSQAAVPQPAASQPTATQGTQPPAAQSTAATESRPPAEPPATAPAVPRESPRPSAPTSGRLVVRSTPSGANVSINGKWRGRTPLTIADAPFGEYSLRVVLRGYEVEQEQFRLSAGDASRTFAFRLDRQAPPPPARRSTPAPAEKPSARTPQAYVGSVYVDSRPRGARVLIDGKAVGTTPLSIPEVSIGSHVVRLELADHRPWTRSVSVTAGETARVTGSLEPIR